MWIRVGVAELQQEKNPIFSARRGFLVNLSVCTLT